MSGQVAARDSANAHLERFEPDENGQRGKLIDAEHRGRYWWVAQVVEGKDVLDAACGTGYGSQILSEAGAASLTGADISAEAVEVARVRLGSAAEVVNADLGELPMDDDSFDVAVCLETIEHVSSGERAVAELRRVLRPDGVLFISSPNPDVYPPGNEHHVHEYRATELAELVRGEFSNVAVYAQHPWLASMIEPAPSGPQNGDRPSGGGGTQAVQRIEPLEPAAQTYSLVVASDAELPALGSQVTLAGDFEVKWWQEQLRKARFESRALARAEEREAEARRQWEEASAALVKANESLVQAIGVSHQLDDLRNSFESSFSWRITAPLRKLRKLLR
jgi:2-polyprenyl-3-methyl-5-hydroxy-6-metoxy-1,4-benzoquinol methylase